MNRQSWRVVGETYTAEGVDEQALLNCINACRREWAKMRREARRNKGG